MNIYEKLSNIQNELKAPKGQRNSFGNYNYRSCEDILEAVKPLCKKHNTVLRLIDTMTHIGDRYYIEAEAILINTDTKEDIDGGMECVSSTAYAREEEIKKGMDGSQITGACSSYARKYALNGLFCIDDTKDADTDAYKKQEDKAKSYNDKKQDIESEEDKKLKEEIEDTKNKPVTPERLAILIKEVESRGITDGQLLEILSKYDFHSTNDIKTNEDLTNVWNSIVKLKKEGK